MLLAGQHAPIAVKGNNNMNTQLLPIIIFAIGGCAAPAAAQKPFRTLYSFANTNPVGLVSSGGVLYGATEDYSACGEVFSLQEAANRAWTESVLHTFTGGGDGCDPLYPPGPRGGRGILRCNV